MLRHFNKKTHTDYLAVFPVGLRDVYHALTGDRIPRHILPTKYFLTGYELARINIKDLKHQLEQRGDNPPPLPFPDEAFLYALHPRDHSAVEVQLITGLGKDEAQLVNAFMLGGVATTDRDERDYRGRSHPIHIFREGLHVEPTEAPHLTLPERLTYLNTAKTVREGYLRTKEGAKQNPDTTTLPPQSRR